MVEEGSDAYSHEKESDLLNSDNSDIFPGENTIVIHPSVQRLRLLSWPAARARLGSLGSSFDSDCDSIPLYSDPSSCDTVKFDLAENQDYQSLDLSTGCFSSFDTFYETPMAEGVYSGEPGMPFEPTETWYFEFPQDLCGRLIGKKGQNISTIKQQSGADIYVTKAWSHVTLRTIKITGSVSQIRSAVDIIESRFPGLHLRRITNVKLLPILAKESPSIKVSQIQLPLNMETEVLLTNVLDAGHFFVQLHSTATQSLLNNLQVDMSACYEMKGQMKHLPSLAQPPVIGTYCSAPAVEGWFRAQVVDVSDDRTMANVVCVDYGCYYKVPCSSLKQLRADFFKVPFQAVECHLADVVPLPNEMTYSAAATRMLEELTQGKVIQAVPRYYRNGILCLDLYVTENNKQKIYINAKMVESNRTRWSNARQDYLPTAHLEELPSMAKMTS